MNDTFRRPPAREETSMQTACEGTALPVAGTSAISPGGEKVAGAPDAPVVEARPFLSPAAPTEGGMPHERESVRRPEKRREDRVVRSSPAGDPSRKKPTRNPSKTTPRPALGTTGNPAGRTPDAGPALEPVIFTGGGKLAGADLTRRTADLAAEYGVSITYVKRVRTQCGITKAQRKRPERVGPLTGVDLTRPTREIVALYGVTAGAVNRARAKNGIPVTGQPQSVLTLPGVDLTRPTKDLANEYEISYSCIAKVRKRLGIRWWHGKKADPGTGVKKKRRYGRSTEERTAAEKRAERAAATAAVKRVSQAQAVAPEPTEKTDAWILRELQADTTPIIILARRWREPLERIEALAARVGRIT